MAPKSFEQKMQQAVEKKEITGAVLAAGDKTGNFRYEKAFGHRSIRDPSTPDPMKTDAVMWMASCTKFSTTIAAMQCVERGLLKLDDAVYDILPELKDLKILTGFDEKNGKDEPILVENTKAITLRHLLTHSSGLAYDFFSPLMKRYRKWQNREIDLFITGELKDAFYFPLVFAPGESWEYGVGIDWAGWMVERVTNTSLEAFMQRNIWNVLGVKGFVFFPQTRSDFMARMTDMSDREGGVTMFGTAADPKGRVVHHQGRDIWNSNAKDCAGGVGSYGSIVDYQAMLHSILADDGKLLKPATVDEMFKPQLSDASRTAFMELMKPSEVNNQFGGGIPLGTECDWGLGGMMNLQDVPGRRKKGTMSWGGYPNLLWFVDRAGGMSGIYGSQLCPPGDPKTVELFVEWENELYRKGREAKL